MSFHYKIFHLYLISELEMPELLPISFNHKKPDVTIRFGKISLEGLLNPIHKTIGFQAKKDQFWMHIPDMARFLVSSGNDIIIDPVDGIDESNLRIFLLGSCFGALLMQRGFFILHGNAVQISNGAISITGHSGAGKSTLSGSLLRRGYSILADDVCTINDKGFVIPSYPQIKLWHDAAKKLLFETIKLQQVRTNVEKYAVPVKNHFYAEPLPLKLVYILNAHNQDIIKIENINGYKKYIYLKLQIYRALYVKGLEQEHLYKIHCSRLASQIELVQIVRPNYGCNLDKLTDAIEADLYNRGLIS